MKKLIFAVSTLALVLFASICISGCGGSSAKLPAEANEMVLNAIENNDFYIEIEKIKPGKQAIREAQEGSMISIKDNILNCNLPYIGELRYSFSKKDAVAFTSEKVSITPKITIKPQYEKYYALLEFTVRNKANSEVLFYKVAVYRDGSAVVKVESQYRDPINYAGWLEERPE